MFMDINADLFEKEKDSRKLWGKLYLKKLEYSGKNT